MSGYWPSFAQRDRRSGRPTRSAARLRLEALEGRRLLSGDPPTAVADAFATPVGQQLAVTAEAGVLSNDTDPESDTLTATVVDQPTHGSVVLANDGSFTYTPDGGYRGTDTFTYVANDGTSDSAPATVTITVDSPPVGVADPSYATFKGVALSVGTAAGVLANDSDPDAGDTLTAVVETTTAHGTLTLSTDGSFGYQPEAGYTGTDTFTYRVSDGLRQSDPITATITITNRAPTTAPDTYSTNLNTPLTIAAGQGVLANDADPDNDPITATVVTTPTHGTLTLAADGSFTYTPETGYRGNDTFTYTTSDGTATTDPTTVTIMVTNRAPVGTPDSGYTVQKGQVLTVAAAQGVLANDTDPDGDPLTAGLLTPATNGTVTLNPDGSFTYTPNKGYAGADSFTYLASDGMTTSTSTVVTIQVSNVVPVAANDSYVATYGQALVVPVATGVLANDTDGNGDTLTATIVTQPANGTVTLNADGSFTYTSSGKNLGTDSFTYRVNDGTTNSAAATVTLNVRPIVTITGTGLITNDTGISGDFVTANTTPGFTGVAPGGFPVQLYAQKAGTANLVLVGQTTARADGLYTVQSSALADGTYLFVVSTTDTTLPNSTPVTLQVGSLTITSASPKITDVRFESAKGRVLLTFSDSLSNLDLAKVLNRANYSVSRATVTRVAVVGDNQIALILNRGRQLAQGRYRLAITAASVTNRAGGALDGEYSGALPTGNGQAGGDFVARLVAKPRKGQVLPIGGTTTAAVAVPGSAHSAIRKASRKV